MFFSLFALKTLMSIFLSAMSVCLSVVGLRPSSSLSTGCVVSLRGDWAIFSFELKTGWQNAISQGKILWNTPPWLGIEPGPQGGQTVSYPAELSWAFYLLGDKVRYVRTPYLQTSFNVSSGPRMPSSISPVVRITAPNGNLIEPRIITTDSGNYNVAWAPTMAGKGSVIYMYYILIYYIYMSCGSSNVRLR